ATIWRLRHAGKFPRPVRIGLRAVGWRISEIEAWIDRLNSTTPPTAELGEESSPKTHQKGKGAARSASRPMSASGDATPTALEILDGGNARAAPSQRSVEFSPRRLAGSESDSRRRAHAAGGSAEPASSDANPASTTV